MPDTPADASATPLARIDEARVAGPWRVDDGLVTRPLHDTAASRALEAAAAGRLPAHELMARAGRATARLARALAPRARRAWVACGPGNNGGDGLVAARWLREAGWDVVVSLLADPSHLPGDAARAWRDAVAAGVTLVDALPPDDPARPADLAVDALLGLGSRRAPEGRLAEAVRRLNAGPAPVLAVDLPTGLSADAGLVLPPGPCVRARWTLSLLTLKPGLFTGEGRARAGDLWFDDLGVVPVPGAATAWLAGVDDLAAGPAARHADGHKGRYGDVHVVGGDHGMVGAVHLCAAAAARAGAGRVFVHPLAGASATHDDAHPELMFRLPVPVPEAGDADTWIVGCGGGRAVAAWLRRGLPHAGRLVVDADGLNAIAASPALATALARRAGRGLPTVLTPHPLEAARLLGATTAQVQADRLGAARALAGRTGACVLLKGSGTVVALPGRAPAINPTGNARLSTAGTGDVLAGWLGGAWSAEGADDAGGAAADALARAWRVAVATAWRHGRAVAASATATAIAADDEGDPALPVLAGELAARMARVAPSRSA